MHLQHFMMPYYDVWRLCRHSFGVKKGNDEIISQQLNLDRDHLATLNRAELNRLSFNHIVICPNSSTGSITTSPVHGQMYFCHAVSACFPSAFCTFVRPLASHVSFSLLLPSKAACQACGTDFLSMLCYSTCWRCVFSTTILLFN